MIYLVYGASGSGKSAFAEKLLAEFPDCKKYYIATMMARKDDADAQKKIARHKTLRAGKGFITIEQPLDVGEIEDKHELQKECGLPGRNTSALLECMSNLCANEMFSCRSCEDGIQKSENEVCRKILLDIKKLSSVFQNLVIVTNNVFDDGLKYDEATQKYIRALGKINCELAAISDKVYEVVVGIPLELK